MGKMYKFKGEEIGELTLRTITLNKVLTGDPLADHVADRTQWEGRPPTPKEFIDALECAREAGYSQGYEDNDCSCDHEED